jgi:hypothetical protein
MLENLKKKKKKKKNKKTIGSAHIAYHQK